MDVALENLPGKADSNAIGNVCSDADSKADQHRRECRRCKIPVIKCGGRISQAKGQSA